MPQHATACRRMPQHKKFFRGTALAWPYLHVSHPIWVLGPGGGGGGGGGGRASKGLVHNLLMQIFTLRSSKMEVFGTYSYDIVIT